MPWGLPFLLYRVCINNRKIYLSSHFIVYVPGCVSVWLPRHRCVSRFACRPGGGHMAPTDLTSLIIFPLSGANHPATQLPSCPNAGRFSRTNHAYMFYLFRPIFTLIEVFSYCRLSHALGHVAFGFGFGFDFGFVCLLDTCKTNKSGKCRGGECFSFGEGVNKYSGNSGDYESFVLP